MLFDIAQNTALAMAVALLYGTLVSIRPRLPRFTFEPAIGLMFAGAAIFAMELSIEVQPGVIVDGRVPIVAMAGVFGGYRSAGVAGLLTAAYRLQLGGSARELESQSSWPPSFWGHLSEAFAIAVPAGLATGSASPCSA
jgi:uncharacterized membrane protein